MLVTREMRDQYERDGYFIFHSEVSESTLDSILDDLKDKYGNADLDVSSSDSVRIQDAWRISSSVKALALSPKALTLLEELYDCPPLPFQTLNFRVGTEQHTHSDTMHFNSMPSGYMCGAWVALEDIDLDNGPLVYYPGSHKLPELTVDHINRAFPPESDFYTTEDLYSRYERLIDSRIERFELKPEYGVLKKGEALIWAANLLHGGAPQNDRGRTRYSQVTHYFFQGCRYYTPLHSRGTEVHWRQPTWITDDGAQSSLPAEPPAAVVTPNYQGFHDVANLRVISGWAWDSNRPNASIGVDIYDGSSFLATVVAGEFRPDVAQHTKDNGCHGFAYRTPSRVASAGQHLITVKVSGTDIVLSNSPKSIADSSA